MNELTTINNLEVIEYNGEPVITLAMTDELHDRPNGTAGRNFRRHRGRLLEGVDYWEIPADEFRRYGCYPPPTMIRRKTSNRTAGGLAG